MGEATTYDSSKRIKLFQTENIKPGSLVLIENNLSIGAELVFYALLEMSRKKEMPLIVEDIFDTLPIYVKHLELMGFYVPLEGMNVIKVGGIDRVGNVVEKLSFEADPNLYISKKERAVSEIAGERPHILLTLGLERLLVFQRDLRDLYSIVRYFRENLNSPKRATISIVEAPILENMKPNPLPMLESVASSVVVVSTQTDAVVIQPKKAMYSVVTGVERIKIDLGTLLEELEE